MFDELLNYGKHPLLGFSPHILATSAILWICDVFQGLDVINVSILLSIRIKFDQKCLFHGENIPVTHAHTQFPFYKQQNSIV